MERVIAGRSLKVSGFAAAVLLSVGAVAGLAPATPSAAATRYWPSIFLNHYTGVKVGQTLKITGKGFPPRITVTLYQCTQAMLDSPAGVFTKKTCDLAYTPTTRTSSKGTIAATITIKKKDIGGQPVTEVSAHSGRRSNWSWVKYSNSDTSPFLTSSPTETWLTPQTVKITGLLIPAVATGTADYAAECNGNVLSGDTKACGTPAHVTVGKKGGATGKLSVVMGTVGDGTCGTGSADEVCYLVLVNLTSTGVITPIATEAIDFYEQVATAPIVTVAGGGTLSAAAAKTTLTAGKLALTCSASGPTPASTASVTVSNGTTSARAPHPIGIASGLAFSNCSSPLGTATLTAAGQPYPVNANSLTSSGATAATLSDLDINVAMKGCKFTVTGSAAGDYSNKTHLLAITPNPSPKGSTKAQLSVSNVGGCTGLIKNGGHPVLTSSYKLSPATLSINSTR
jgi:neocarzinostatin family protein